MCSHQLADRYRQEEVRGVMFKAHHEWRGLVKE